MRLGDRDALSCSSRLMRSRKPSCGLCGHGGSGRAGEVVGNFPSRRLRCCAISSAAALRWSRSCSDGLAGWSNLCLPCLPHRNLVQLAELEQPLPDGRQLFTHQRAAARWLLARRGAVLADAMGLGKTLTALAAARAMVRAADCRIVVVAPAGLHRHWRQEASALQLQLELLSWARPSC